MRTISSNILLNTNVSVANVETLRTIVLRDVNYDNRKQIKFQYS